MKWTTAFVVTLCLHSEAFGQRYPGSSQPPRSPLTLNVTGDGSISPNLNNRLLRIGTTYKITARPGSGFVFSNWSGGVVESDPRLTFVMQSNLVIQANFVPSPFVPVKGEYTGLFFGDSGASFTNSGFIKATLTERGRFTARLTLAGRSYALQGQFTTSGSFSNAVPRRGQTPLGVQLQLDLAGGDRMVGVVGDGSLTASVTAHRATFSPMANPAPIGNKRYTLILAPDENASQSPRGFGHGTLTVDLAGNVRFAGSLGDGTKFSQATFVSKAGDWPLFASLKSGTGVVLGWLAFTNPPAGDIGGRVSWFQLPRSSRPIYSGPYSASFALPNGVQASGGLYSFSSGIPLLTLTDGGVVFLQNGNLPQSIINSFTIDANNRVTSPDGLSVRVSTGTGLFSGKVLNPATRRRITIQGALLQKRNAGFGHFLGTGAAGSVYLGPTNGLVMPPPPIVTIGASDTNASEGGPDPGRFTISRIGGLAGALTVKYSVSGTAANGSDYATVPGSVTIPAGSSSASVTVHPVDDSAADGNKTIVLTLAPDIRYTIGSPDSATVTITDNDQPLPTIAKVRARLPTDHGDLPYYANRPLEEYDPRVTRAIIIIHGAGGNFESYFDRIYEIVPPEWNKKVMVLAPHFQDTGEAGNSDVAWDGDWREGGAAGGLSSFTAVDTMVGLLRNGNFPNLKWVVIAGHSAGGQFAQRYAAFTDIDLQPAPNSEFVKFVPANPSSYVYLNPFRYDNSSDTWVIPQQDCSGEGYNEYKYGLDNLFDYAAARGAEWARSRLPRRWVELLAGTQDVEADDSFDSDCAAMWQGSTRYERAQIFGAFMDRFYPANNFRVTRVPGIGHDSTLIFASPQGRKALFFPD